MTVEDAELLGAILKGVGDAIDERPEAHVFPSEEVGRAYRHGHKTTRLYTPTGAVVGVGAAVRLMAIALAGWEP